MGMKCLAVSIVKGVTQTPCLNYWILYNHYQEIMVQTFKYFCHQIILYWETLQYRFDEFSHVYDMY